MFNKYLKKIYGEKTKNPWFFMLVFFLGGVGGGGWVFWVGFLLPTL